MALLAVQSLAGSTICLLVSDVSEPALNFYASTAANKKPGTLRWGLDQTLIDYAAFFLRQPRRPNPARPVAKSGSVAGSGTTGVDPTGVKVRSEPNCAEAPEGELASPAQVVNGK